MTIIRVVKHPSRLQTNWPPHHSLAAQMAVNNEFSWPDIAAELNNTGRSSDKFPQPSLDTYGWSTFLIRPFFVSLTSQITGGKKQSDEGAGLFAVRVNLPCYCCACVGFLCIFPFSSNTHWATKDPKSVHAVGDEVFRRISIYELKARKAFIMALRLPAFITSSS